jgi:gamma-glutamylcyclotransferase (GGCT)/AIG2-like uncharacterized protein YtfP
MVQYLFVYGTLLPGLAPPRMARIVSRLRDAGPAYARGKLYSLGKYPGAVLRKQGPKVWGRLFVIPEAPEFLQKMDEYEELDSAHPGRSEYVRQLQTIFLCSGKRTPAWVYVYNRRPGRALRIASGDFAAWRQMKLRKK